MGWGVQGTIIEQVVDENRAPIRSLVGVTTVDQGKPCVEDTRRVVIYLQGCGHRGRVGTQTRSHMLGDQNSTRGSGVTIKALQQHGLIRMGKQGGSETGGEAHTVLRLIKTQSQVGTAKLAA